MITSRFARIALNAWNRVGVGTRLQPEVTA
jgi:hypothetical protein